MRRQCSLPLSDACPPLVSFAARYPNLSYLRVSVSEHDKSESGKSAMFGVASHFDIARTLAPGCHGPVPWSVLSARQLTAIELTTVMQVGRKDLEADAECHLSAWRESPMISLFLTTVVPCAVRLLSLDLTGTAPLLFGTLLRVDLPSLLVLRAGGMRGLHERAPLCWPDHALSTLAAHFPSLTALDVGYMLTGAGVSSHDVGAACRSCRLEHLDLCMVMTYVDFGPSLRILGRVAPQLCSLAVYGLSLPADGLEALALGCPQVARPPMALRLPSDCPPSATRSPSGSPSDRHLTAI